MKKYLFLAVLLKFLVLVWPGVVMADTTLNGKWQDFYNEGDSFRVDRGVSVTTTKPLERAGGYLKTGYWTWNMKESVVSFRVKVSNWADAKVVTLIVGNGLKFENAATFDIRQRFVGAANDEWVEVVVPQSAWTVEGTVDWENIDSVLFSVMDTGERRITAQIANIKVMPATKTPGAVSITFDDGLPDTIVGASIMKRHGFVGTAFIDVLAVGTPGFITDLDVVALGHTGWDISGHNMGRLTRLKPEALVTHLKATEAYLVRQGFPGSRLYALPNGERNAAVADAMATRIDWVFNIDGMANDRGHLLPGNVNRHSIDKHTSLALAKRWVDDAVVYGEWVIINFHSFSDDWAKEEDWTTEDFAALLTYIQEKHIAVLPISAVLAK